MVETGAANYKVILEDGEVVFPCRCGQTHAGPYAEYDYGHHECLHDTTLRYLDPENPSPDVVCPLCGKVWQIGV